MRILHVSQYSDIRAFKQALIMADRGHEVDILSPSVQNFGGNIYNSAMVYLSDKQLENSIRNSMADVIHVHTEPDWLVSKVKTCAGDRPVIFDWHDPESIRHGGDPLESEKQAFADADAVIHVSDGFRYLCEKTHGVGKKPITVIHSLVPDVFYKHIQSVSWDSICYEGGLSNAGHTDPKFYHYRNLEYVVDKFIEAGYNFSLYTTANSEIGNTYDMMGAFVCRGAYYGNMLAGLRVHGFGFVGTAAVMKLLNNTLPNKLYEYISQGVVPVCWNAEESGRFCEQNGIGINLTGDLDDLRERLKEGPALREKLLKVNRNFAMESEAEKLERFYSMLI